MSLPVLYSNVQKYAGILEKMVCQIEQGDQKYEQVSIMNKPDRLRLATSIDQTPDQQHRVLVYPKDKPDEEPEEMVLRMQGYLVQARLPPILNRKQLGSSPWQARQSVTLSGLGTACFSQGLLGIMKVAEHFRQSCAEGHMDIWEANKERGYPIVSAGARYLTTKTDTNTQDIRELGDIDPLGLLSKAVPTGIHTSENQVLYFERLPKNKGPGWTYKPVSPATICIGQIVEVQLAFSTVSTKRNKQVFLLNLRSICIMDRTLQEDLSAAAMSTLLDTMGASTSSSLKRRVGYNQDEDQVSMAKRMKKLRMGTESDMETVEEEEL